MLAAKHEIAAAKAHVDFGLYGLLGEDTIEHVPALVEGGVIGFKLYMGNTFGKIPSPVDRRDAGSLRGGRADRQAHLAARRDQLDHGAPRRRGCGTPAARDPLAHLASRPAVVAVEAVSRAAILAEWTGARIHILHISSAEELRPLREAKARGVDITGETCPQYLLLSTDDYARVGGVIRVNPPVREARNQEPLWAALARRHDRHDRHRPRAACARGEDPQRHLEVDCGFPGVETQMPLMLTEVDARPLRICDYVRWSAANPAKAWGLYPRKGVHRSPARTPTSRSSTRRASGRSTTPSCSRAPRSRPGTAAA